VRTGLLFPSSLLLIARRPSGSLRSLFPEANHEFRYSSEDRVKMPVNLGRLTPAAAGARDGGRTAQPGSVLEDGRIVL